MIDKEKIEEFIFERAIPEPNTGCWIWTLGVNKNGYGKLKKNGKSLFAHRYVYEAMIGRIPNGMQIDHVCAMVCCVNPAHLEPVTCRENIRRAQKRNPESRVRLGKISQKRRDARTHCPHGHPYSGDNVRIASNKQRVCKTCMRERMRRRRHPEKLKRDSEKQKKQLTLNNKIYQMIMDGYSIRDIMVASSRSKSYILRNFKIRQMRRRVGKAIHRL